MAGRVACGFSILIPRAARLSSAGVFTDVADLAQDVRNGGMDDLDDRVDVNIDGLPEVKLSQKHQCKFYSCQGAVGQPEPRNEDPQSV